MRKIIVVLATLLFFMVGWVAMAEPVLLTAECEGGFSLFYGTVGQLPDEMTEIRGRDKITFMIDLPVMGLVILVAHTEDTLASINVTLGDISVGAMGLTGCSFVFWGRKTPSSSPNYNPPKRPA